MPYLKFLKPGFLKIAIYSFILVGCFFAFVTTSIVPKDLTLQKDGVAIDSSKQIYFANYQEGDIVFSGTLEKKRWQQSIVEIQVDDCLDKVEINNQVIDISQWSSDRICSWQKGKHVDLGSFLKEGQNDFKFTIRNYGGEAGLKINPSPSDHIFVYILIITLLAACSLLYEIILILKLDKKIATLFILALVIRLIYYSYTGFNIRQHDALGDTGHLGYINYVANNWRLPDPQSGFEYHQPPLYYIISGIIFAGLKLLGIYNIFDVIQLFSIAYVIIFLIFGVKILSLSFEKNTFWYYLAASLLLFWPSGIIHSVRITNDSLFWAFFGGFIYFLLKWFKNPSPLKLLPVSAFFTLGMITKSNMILAVPMFGMAVLIHLISIADLQIFNIKQPLVSIKKVFSNLVKFFQKLKYDIKTILLYLSSLAFVVISFIVNPDLISSIRGKPLEQFIGSTQLNSQLKVGEGLQHYLYFDIPTFLNTSFMSSWSDENGRQWFWNFFFKTSLFGEFSFPKQFSQDLAILISFAVIILLTTVIYYFFSQKKLMKQDWLLLSMLAIFILGAMFHRKENPYAPNSDFRFVFPVLILLSYFFATSVQFLSTKKHQLALFFGLFSGLTLVVSSLVFFIDLFIS